jgi:branched-chain amino acid transport system ATP-binding protein
MEAGCLRFRGLRAGLIAGRLTAGGRDVRAERRGVRAWRSPELMAGKAALEVAGLTKRFGGTVALDEVSFTVSAGECLGIVGPNGSGKTTLLRCVTGLFSPDAGAVAVHGALVAAEGMAPSVARVCDAGVTQTFQRTVLAEDSTVAENILVGRSGLRSPRVGRSLLRDVFGLRSALDAAQRRALVDVLLATGIERYADTVTGALPLGVKRRVELARALVRAGSVLLLDEPTSGLDRSESRDMVALLSEVRRARNVTIVIVEHDMEVIRALCDRVVVLDFGRKLLEGDTGSALGDERVKRAYLGVA